MWDIALGVERNLKDMEEKKRWAKGGCQRDKKI
jgi:hypothetical protein